MPSHADTGRPNWTTEGENVVRARAYVGLDVGAVSTNLALLDADLNVVDHWYLRTEGDPLASIKAVMKLAGRDVSEPEVVRCGTTGSGRHLAAALVGADVVKNEITAHAAGALSFFPEARTIIEIGGQDSKIIVIEDGAVVDFAMNTVCAAGTGSLLDYQASRMSISIDEFAQLAAESAESVRISGRCAVFAETDIIDKQQKGAGKGMIARGLCECLVRNFLSTVASGKRIDPPVIFQGGVASNIAVRQAFERELGTEVEVPEYHNVMGAIGVAMLAERAGDTAGASRFRGFEVRGEKLSTGSFECDGCSNSCEILEIYDGEDLISRWGSRCGRWDPEQ
jgi:predicted CoA-substrate-specific enzyme activase